MWLHDVIKLCLLLCLDRRHPIVAEATHCAFNISLWRHFFLWTFSAFTLCHSSILCMTSCMCLMLFTALFFLNIFLFTFWSLHVVHVSFVLVFLLLFVFFLHLDAYVTCTFFTKNGTKKRQTEPYLRFKSLYYSSAWYKEEPNIKNKSCITANNWWIASIYCKLVFLFK